MSDTQKSWHQQSLLCMLVLQSALLVGCSSEPPMYPVRGSVKYAGKPLPYGTMRFFDTAGAVLGTASINESGAYELMLPAGEHVVTVYAVPEAESDPDAYMYEGGVLPGSKPTGPEVPSKYGDIGSSPLRIQVSEGENTHDIDIPGVKRRR